MRAIRKRSVPPPAGTLSLASAGRTVPVDAALRLPDVMLLVTEDACARIAEADWRLRRPSWRRPRARLRWYRERRQLRAKTARVRALAEEYLDR